MYMILVVLLGMPVVEEVLLQFRKAGIRGATVLPSIGMQCHLAKQLRIPQRYAFEQQAEGCMEDNYTIFSVVPDEAAVQACLEAAEVVVGDFDSPNNGIFISWSLGFCKGVSSKQHHQLDS